MHLERAVCRGVSQCTELPNTPQSWDHRSPLPPPHWIHSQIEIFLIAVDELISGHMDTCHEIIHTLRAREFCEWYIEHGQNSGRFRAYALSYPKPQPAPESERDVLRSPTRYQEEVFKRDGYRCRYCGIKLIAQQALKVIIKKLGHQSFQKGPTNLTTHGIIHATWPVADHVVPWNLGGRTAPSNLVSSCASCNYGKANYTIEQLGLDSPWDFVPMKNHWNGLTSKISAIDNA